ncbi:hypothetical protein [Methylobacterium gregans]|uniref:Uncharacterized protein n=1 Tax=Methylobacterium gregans TaxID=374424 RepID=A0AA37HU68_9HYPH|nr:hypothetical protein [Methylobacterium gregans]MDQ0518759.1 hypothetical protein [Methylobacterium gregans]GJD81756.1 hypothetical protein NBEOAGPD_5010 [Methylobacterium gregans]GLS56484.1 hypothetical protein GCM10007886_46690 [Methylobacterium gregans]
MRQIRGLGLAAGALAGLLAAGSVQAQYYDAPPRRGYDEERPYAAPPPRRAVGYNCDAVQRGLTGPQPFSCPLPGPRPLGARCFCDLPIAPLSAPQTAVGRVVP